MANEATYITTIQLTTLQKMILAIIVTYFPEKELLERNFNAFIDSVDKVLIWENTPSEKREDYRFIHHEKAEYCGDGINSISHALNYAWRYAQAGKYDYLLTMDQDSCFENFPYYLEQTIHNANAPEGIYTPPIKEKPIEFTKDLVEIERPITSGMLIPVNLINKIGGWDEEFKIDSVDDEFCLHAHLLGIKIFAVKDIVMQHRLGNPETRNFLGHTITLRNYPPSRLYGFFRNNFILAKKYPQYPYVRKDLKDNLKNQLIWITLLEDNKTRKIASIIRGCIAGLSKRL